jgi:hypothetical protein
LVQLSIQPGQVDLSMVQQQQLGSVARRHQEQKGECLIQRQVGHQEQMGLLA